MNSESERRLVIVDGDFFSSFDVFPSTNDLKPTLEIPSKVCVWFAEAVDARSLEEKAVEAIMTGQAIRLEMATLSGVSVRC